MDLWINGVLKSPKNSREIEGCYAPTLVKISGNESEVVCGAVTIHHGKTASSA